jgi:hypothetical protein
MMVDRTTSDDLGRRMSELEKKAESQAVQLQSQATVLKDLLIQSKHPFLSEIVYSVFQRVVDLGVDGPSGIRFRSFGDCLSFVNDPLVDSVKRSLVYESVLSNAATITGLDRAQSDIYFKCIKNFKKKRNEEQHPKIDKSTCRQIVNECFQVDSIENMAFQVFLNNLAIPDNPVVEEEELLW